MRRSHLLATAAVSAALFAACGGGSGVGDPTAAAPQATTANTAVTKPSGSGLTPVLSQATPAPASAVASPTTAPNATTTTPATNTQVSATQAPATQAAATNAPATQSPPPTPTPPKASANPLSANVGVTGAARYFWSPNSLKIAPGGSVTFEWSGGAAHDLSVPGVGFEGAAKVAASYTVAFPSAGEYEMICIIHSATMKGKIIVE